jgi:hypothetical protein
MKTKRSIKTVVTAVIILAAGCGLAGVIDQRQENVNLSEGAWAILRNDYGMERNLSLWQSFQAGMSGDFLGVELYWSGFSEGSTIDLCLYDGTGVNTSSLIHREPITFPEYASQTWHLLSFSNLYPALLAGSTYTFALEDASDNSASIQAGSLGVDSYANGVFWMQGYSSQGTDAAGAGDTDWDVGFRTVMIPEPATATMLALSGLLIVGYRRFFGRV